MNFLKRILFLAILAAVIFIVFFISSYTSNTYIDAQAIEEEAIKKIESSVGELSDAKIVNENSMNGRYLYLVEYKKSGSAEAMLGVVEFEEVYKNKFVWRASHYSGTGRVYYSVIDQKKSQIAYVCFKNISEATSVDAKIYYKEKDYPAQFEEAFSFEVPEEKYVILMRTLNDDFYYSNLSDLVFWDSEGKDISAEVRDANRISD